MARKKDLAGLATLAGLAYMATRDKAGKGDSADVAPSAPAAAKEDTGGDFNEAGSGPAPAADENYGNEGRREGPMGVGKTTPSAPRPAAKPMGGSGRGKQGGASAEELAAYAASKPKKPQYQSLQDRARAYEEERAASGAGGMYGTPSKRREPLPTAEDMAYKKGGKVKKMASGGGVKGWGIARGSRKAKTY
jgi:hypothetical protein